MLMFNPFGATRARARQELARQLDSIAGRLESLETAPAPGPSSVQIDRIMTDVLGRLTGKVEELERAGETYELKFKHLGLAVSEGIERVDRSERRIYATIKRARKELKKLGYEDPGLEAENTQLRLVDGEGGSEGGMPVVQGQMDGAADPPSSSRGVSAATLSRVRGF